jgi:hypothetical protein
MVTGGHCSSNSRRSRAREVARSGANERGRRGDSIPYLTYRGDASWWSNFVEEVGGGCLFILFLGDSTVFVREVCRGWHRRRVWLTGNGKARTGQGGAAALQVVPGGGGSARHLPGRRLFCSCTTKGRTGAGGVRGKSGQARRARGGGRRATLLVAARQQEMRFRARAVQGRAEQGHAGRRLCRGARKDGAQWQGLAGRLGLAIRGGRRGCSVGQRGCSERLNRLGDIVLGSSSDEDKDTAAHRARTRS